MISGLVYAAAGNNPNLSISGQESVAPTLGNQQLRDFYCLGKL